MFSFQTPCLNPGLWIFSSLLGKWIFYYIVDTETPIAFGRNALPYPYYPQKGRNSHTKKQNTRKDNLRGIVTFYHSFLYICLA